MFDIINPRQTVLVTCQAEVTILGQTKLKDNLITLDWHMPVSFKPMLYAIAIGKTRFSYKLIAKSGVFAVNFIPATLKEAAVYCGTRSGEHIDKFQETGVTRVQADSIVCPIIREAVAHLECEVIQEVDAGDHVIFIGKVTGTNKRSEERRLFHTDSDNFSEL